MNTENTESTEDTEDTEDTESPSHLMQNAGVVLYLCVA